MFGLGTGMLIIIGAAVAVFFWGVAAYNNFVRLVQQTKEAWADIDVQLKRRYDLIPNLVETVKGYAAHEKETFEQVTAMRAKVKEAGSQAERLEAEKGLGNALINLNAVAENYPELKADQNFQQLMAELADIENKIAAARRFFNNATSELNTAIQQFPANLIAGRFGFSEQEFYEVEEAERKLLEQAPDVKFD